MSIPVQHKAHAVADQLTHQMETEGIILCALGPGDVFGWSALVPSHQSTASAKALADCRILAFARQDMVLSWWVERYLVRPMHVQPYQCELEAT